MARAGVEAAIARLDAIGRERALTETESRQLQKLIRIERQYQMSRKVYHMWARKK